MVDVEDVAMTADELAPGRFRWRKYADQINIQYIGKALRDAKQRGFATGTSARGWMLTEAGIAEARSLVPSSSEIGNRRAQTKQEKAWLHREKIRLLSEDAFKKFMGGRLSEITDREILRFFKLDEYVVGETRKARIARITHSFSTDPDLGPAIQSLVGRVPQ